MGKLEGLNNDLVVVSVGTWGGTRGTFNRWVCELYTDIRGSYQGFKSYLSLVRVACASHVHGAV